MIKTNADLIPTEAIIDNIFLNVGTIGLEKVGRPIMLTGLVERDPRNNGNASFYDLFLTVEHAESLLSELPAVIARAKGVKL